jgi:nucleoside-diphosphate-sugar epimerase
MITVLGASGFIGSHIVAYLEANNRVHYVPARNEDISDRNLGDIIYCIGLTADFRQKPFDTVEAHVCKLNSVLKSCKFKSLTYLSSTRIYINSTSQTVREEDKILVDPCSTDELYTLTKLTGESICLASKRITKIVRLSNIYGNDLNSNNFLTDILKNINKNSFFALNLSLSSSKDYLFIDDAVKLLVDISTKGKNQIYNLASGENVSNKQIIDELNKNINFLFEVNKNAKEIIFPTICINKIKEEFDFKPSNIIQYIPSLVKQFLDVQN